MIDFIKQTNSAFSLFTKKINKLDIDWAITGSFRLYLEDSLMSKKSDIDVVTNEKGFRMIQFFFQSNVTSAFYYKRAGKIKSFFGQLKINGITFDIMADVCGKANREWVQGANLSEKEILLFKGEKIPVLSLKEELRVCKLFENKEKLNRIYQLSSTVSKK